MAHTCSERWQGAADGFSQGTVTHERAAERNVLIVYEERVAWEAGGREGEGVEASLSCADASANAVSL